MKYVSTRNKARLVSAAEAIAEGISPEGGLYIPTEIPVIAAADIDVLSKASYAECAAKVLSLFLPDFGQDELLTFAEKAYGGGKFDAAAVAPLVSLDDSTHVLELWHGPTAAFKDMALQMLPHLLTASLQKTGEEREVCILVATSGDTGKAALEGFCDVEGTRIVVFYPKDGVSRVQQLQMTTQKGQNVSVCAVEGNFDDCQTGVKKIFADTDFAAQLTSNKKMLSSANSINWGRLVPQVVYYISAYCNLVSTGRIQNGDPINVCVPTGNFGNILSGLFAKKMGLPIGKFLCASNVNNVLSDFIKTGVYDRNRDFKTTISPSMDILISSNVERLLYLLSDGDTDFVAACMNELASTGKYTLPPAYLATLQELFYGSFADDSVTKSTIAAAYDKYSYLSDTHTAVAFDTLETYRKETGDKTPTVILSTASPYKFADSVLSALGGNAEGLSALAELSERTSTTCPKPLCGLDKAEERFSGFVPKGEMRSFVEAFLG